ncbi:hypothetical protein VISI1226_13698 [Vibrio sinaloensis DSM 21326]|uniref:Uncharacterized protein n=1 Tax=Vibrio sinaloensis DSM 21326 TaxID=945550 RepID=E8M8N5_PHOS4|nr:hypothetical protein [Vibrio sinaloensis]EGA69580.1 hypothetical protein VISI1226_13698 [Vibrio sinaloensis DSM 21326]
MPLIPVALLAGGFGLWGGYTLSNGTKYLTGLVILLLVVFVGLKVSGGIL